PPPPCRHLRQRPQPPHPPPRRATHPYGTPTCRPAPRDRATADPHRPDGPHPSLLPLRRYACTRTSPVHQPPRPRRGRGPRRPPVAPVTAGPGRRAGDGQQGTGRHDTVIPNTRFDDALSG